MSVKEIILKGVCASKGEATGIVHIATDSNLTPPKENGYILVCRHTNPAYMLLFMNAAAVVTETGGIVCHAAIVSREMGLPCVVGVKGILETVHEGQRMRVDATKGVVYV